jgi:hypothetical protein
MILILAVFAAFSEWAYAELPSRGNISLYADGSRLYNSYCRVNPGNPLAKFELWIWCLPSENGLRGAEFAVSRPTNVILDRTVYNADLSFIEGDPLLGLSASFGACQWDWCWIAHQTFYINSVEATSIEILPHPGIGVFQFRNCETGNPAEPCLRGTTLYLNVLAPPCLPPEAAIGAEGSTWGGMKRLFSKATGAPFAR